jgi:hypothetical protein
MKVLKLMIDDVEKDFTVPTEWADITVNQLQGLSKLNPDNMTSIEYMGKSVSVLIGVDYDDLMLMDPNDFMNLAEEIKFINTEIKPEPKDSIEIDGETYWLKKDYSKLTMGEVISVETIMNDSNQELSAAMDKMLCIFLRKKDENGKLENFKNEFMDRAEMFGNINVVDVYDLMINFSNIVSS